MYQKLQVNPAKPKPTYPEDKVLANGVAKRKAVRTLKLPILSPMKPMADGDKMEKMGTTP